jgi:hypothetical protein
MGFLQTGFGVNEPLRTLRASVLPFATRFSKKTPIFAAAQRANG